MEKKVSRSSYIDIFIDGKNVSTDLAPYLLSTSFNDKTSNEVDDVTITIDDRDGLFCDQWMPMIGDRLELAIKSFNWSNDGDEDELYCGQFDIDLVTESGPPSIFNIKAVSSLCSNIRRTLNNKKWQQSSLKSIGQQIATKYGLEYEFIPYYDEEELDGVKIDEVNQNDQSDLTFLSKLAEDNDYVIKLNPDKLTICSQAYLEAQEPLFTLSRNEISNRSAGRQGFDLYKEAKASYFCSKQKKNISSSVQHNQIVNNPEWLAAHNKSKKKPKKTSSTTPSKPTSVYSGNAGTKVLIIRQKFKTEQEAKRKAMALLAQKNRGEWRLSGEVMGSVQLMAGIVIEVIDYGQFSGFYYVESTTHIISNSGYRTSFTAHKVLFTEQPDDE